MKNECYLISLDGESPVPLGRFTTRKDAENSGIRKGCDNFITVESSDDLMLLLTGKDEMSLLWRAMHPDDPEGHLVRFSRRVEGSERLWKALTKHNFKKPDKEFQRRKNPPLSTVVLGVLEQGDPVSVSDLAASLGVGRTKVTNAINSIRQSGCQITRVSKGVFQLDKEK